jgi:hypothetical protein
VVLRLMTKSRPIFDRAAIGEAVNPHLKIFFKNAFRQKGYPL